MASVSQPAGHGPRLDAGDDAHGGKERNDGGAAVADKGEGQPHNGQNIEAHAHIEGDLAQQRPGHPHAHVGGEGGAGVPPHPDTPQDNGGQQQQQGHTAHQAQFLAADGEDQVAVPDGEGVAAGGLGLHALQISLAEELAGTDSQSGRGQRPPGSA